ncbi:hypothetical protein ACFU1R_06015 [Priestia megaterium]|uniref:hypothetical protein n=1 Tax=Priestia megaterium TaxID=1404 RepID=UPI003670A724
MSTETFGVKDSVCVSKEWIGEEIEEIMIQLENNIVNKQKNNALFNLGILFSLIYLTDQNVFMDSRYASMDRLVRKVFDIDPMALAQD